MESKNNRSKSIAVFGTGSDVGKSIVAAALCRYFAGQGRRVAPFKAQNMSNNSGVTPEGLEMGRAQIVQAEAARIPPHVDMNPILLKPTSEVGCQVVLLGRALENRTASEYHAGKAHLFAQAAAAFDRLRRGHELIVLEGAGSCAEVNLMSHDIVNFRMAAHAGADVLLVADIHRGGVFAQIVGTLSCLPPELRDRVKGFIINRFRGDLSLFQDGREWIEARTGKPVLGVLPWYDHITIDAEDSVVIENPKAARLTEGSPPAVAVIRVPHISNFTDFDPLARTRGISLFFLEKVQDLTPFAAVILPGSKNTRHDLEWLHRSGWTRRLDDFVKSGGSVLGICGGYQMMGTMVHDPGGLEGFPGSTRGVGLLPVETTLTAPKTTTLTRFAFDGIQGSGYEIHMGKTRRHGGNAMLTVTQRNLSPIDDEDGCVAGGGRIMGTYLHGFFDTPAVTMRWLETAGIEGAVVDDAGGLPARDRQYDLLAAHLSRYVDMPALTKVFQLGADS